MSFDWQTGNRALQGQRRQQIDKQTIKSRQAEITREWTSVLTGSPQQILKFSRRAGAGAEGWSFSVTRLTGVKNEKLTFFLLCVKKKSLHISV